MIKIESKMIKKSNPIPTLLIIVVLVVIFIGMGEKMAERFLPLYLLTIGGSVFSVGFLNGMDNLLSALYSFPGGYISDKIGSKKALILFTIIAMFGYLIVILVVNWWAVLVGALFFISWTAISLPAIMSLVSTNLPKNKRTLGVSVHSLVRRIPMGLGPVLGGVLIGKFGRVQGIRLSFCVAFLLGLISIGFLQKFKAKETSHISRSFPIKESIHFINKPLRNLLISDILIRFAEQIPYAFVVVWAVNNNGITEPQFGYLTAIEMTVAMLLYIPIALLADRCTKKPFILITFINFTLFPLVLLFTRSFTAFIFAFILRGLKEFGEPTRKALIMDLAPENAKATTFGTYYLLRDIIVSAAAFTSAYLWNISPRVNFLTAFACGLLGTIYFAVYGKDLNKV
jgi:MFS family permease